DRICFADPAKEVAMFVHRARSLLFKDAKDTPRAERIVREFLEQYRKLAPRNLNTLPCRTALYALKGFAKIAKDRGPNDPLRRPMEFFYLSTLEGSFKSGERMPASVVRAESNLNGTGTSKEELGRWACTFKDSDFIGKFVYPTVDSGLSGAGAG